MGLGIFGGNTSSRSDSTTNNFDQRVVADANGVGFSGNGSTLTITDGGLYARALDTVDRNLKLVNDTATGGYDKLFAATERMFDKQTAASTQMAGTVEKNVLDAYRNASSDAKGTIDNKTIIGLAVAAVVAFAATRLGK